MLIITELPKAKEKKQDFSGIWIDGYNQLLSEIKSKAVRVDVEKLADKIAANQRNTGLECKQLAQSIKQAIERGELLRHE